MVSRSLVTIKEMMLDRGCNEHVHMLEQIPSEQVNQLVSQKMIFTIDSDNGELRILYALSPKFRLQDIKKYLEGDFKCIILVSRDKITSTNVKSIEDLSKCTQIFELRELYFNITKHVFVPKHEVINDEKLIAHLVEIHHLKNRNQFPIILKSDPVAKYLNAKPGCIVKITRYSPTSGEHIIYRCCV